jgi:membrane protein YqaA with SNARE-associated domain
VRSLSTWIIGLVVSPLGVVALAALDSTLFFSLPGGVDAAVILLSAQRALPAWTVPLLATAGSVCGAAVTFWMGVKIGAQGLDRHLSLKRVARIRRNVHSAGAIGMAALDLIPPPFPFTPFILAAGALKVDRRTFFGTLAACRLLRFGAEAMLAVIYGRRLLTWLDSDTFHDFVIVASVLGVVLTIVSIAKLFRSSRSARRSAAA